MKTDTRITLHYFSLAANHKIFLFLITILFYGCSPIYYVPNTQNVPIMKAKGQTNLFLGLNESENTDAFEFQGAYGFTEKWALQLNTDWVKSSEDNSISSGTFFEIGGGYYKSISKSFVFESYGLVGYGSFDYQDNSIDNSDISANLYKIGVQPSISFSGKYFNASLSSRLATINYNNVSGSLLNEVYYLQNNKSFWLIEPALTVQGGFENIKLQLQLQASYNLTSPDFSQDYSLVSLGLKVNWNSKLHRIQK